MAASEIEATYMRCVKATCHPNYILFMLGLKILSIFT